MAEAARQIVCFAQPAIEAWRVRIAARAAHHVAAHAERFAGPGVTARTGQWIHARRLSVRVRGAWRAGPAWRMRVASRGVLPRDTETGVAVDAEELAVTDHTLPWVHCGLLIVNADEVRPVHGAAHGLVEAEPRGNRRHRDAVARRALALRVARGAEVALRVGLHSVLAEEVPVVDDVALRERHFTREVDVTATAVA